MTSDEDHRQELWLHYLGGNSSMSFAERLEQLKNDNVENQRIAETIWLLLNNPEAYNFREMLTGFSELEQSIMCLLAIGLNVFEISQYKTLSIIRVQQVITAIRNHSKWNEVWHLNKVVNAKIAVK